MRVKQLWSLCDIPAKASLVWSRITFSRLTTVYFLLAVVHCLVQVLFQVQAFSINATAAVRLWAYVQGANLTQEANGFAILGNDLRICYTVPDSITAESCTVIWSPTNQSGPSYGLAAASLSASVTSVAAPSANSLVAATLIATTSAPSSTPTISHSAPSLSATAIAVPTSSSASSPLASTSASPSKTTVVVAPSSNAGKVTTVVVTDSGDEKEDGDEEEHNGTGVDHDRRRSFRSKRNVQVSSDVSSNGTTVGVTIFGLHSDNLASGGPQHLAADMKDATSLDDTCVQALLWPVQKLSDNKREDITFIMFQIWVLGMSIVALLNESIQHTVAALVTHLLATIWAIYQIFQTEDFRQDFARLITNGACKPNNLLGDYWAQRRNAEIASAVLNGVVLLVSVFLSFKLTKIYGWQTFKRVGASLTINRVYKLVLALSISIQLGLFFIVSAMALWIDQLMHGSIAHLASLATVYKGVFIAVFCLLFPWLALGWFSVRREKRKSMLVFLIISLIFIGLWAAMFKSSTFRWTFVTWTFFTVMAVTAGILMISTFLLGLACRFNFGKGLPRYLNAEEPLDGDDFTPVFYEKDQYDDDPEKVEFPSSNVRPVPTFSATFGRGPEVPKPTQMRFGPSRGPDTGMYDGTQVSQQELLEQQRGHIVGRSISSSSTHSGRSDLSLTRTDTRGSNMTHQSGSSTSSGRMAKRWVIE